MSVVDIVIPAEAGEVEECVVVTWLKKEGDSVQQGDEILILQAEKVSFEVPAPASGIIRAILAKQGEVVTRRQPLARLELSAEAAAAPPPADVAPAVPPRPQPAREVRASPIARRLAREHDLDLGQVPASGDRLTKKDVLLFLERQAAPKPEAAPLEPAREVRASPSARRLAREHGLDLAQVPLAGGSARLTEREVEAYLARQQPAAPPPSEAVGQSLPFAGMRATIAQRMQQSLQEMAQLTLHTEADVTELIAFRAQLKQNGQSVTYTDLIVKASALALKQHPHLNATLVDQEIRLLPHINIGLAVAIERGLVVPVLYDADQAGLTNLAASRARLVERAQAGQLTTEEMSGGTFTVTNLGTYDIDAFTPIVNPPEVAILGVGRIVEKVVIHTGKIAQRSMMTLSLSFDHRLVDGAPAAAFLQSIKQMLEGPTQAGL